MNETLRPRPKQAYDGSNNAPPAPEGLGDHMKGTSIQSTALLLAGFAAGLLASRLPSAAAAINSAPTDLSKTEFIVSIDEIRQNFVFGEPFVGHYYRQVTLSDGSVRRIQLTPMIHRGMQVVELRDNGGLSYMGLDGTTTDGTLMIQLRDAATMLAQARAEGWPFATSKAATYPIPILPIVPVRVVFRRVHTARFEAMTVTNETAQPMDLFVAVLSAGKYVGTRHLSVPASASSTVEASQDWNNPSPRSREPGLGPQTGDQVTLIDIPNRAARHEAKYQQWHGTVP